MIRAARPVWRILLTLVLAIQLIPIVAVDHIESFALYDHRNVLQKIDFPTSRNTVVIVSDREAATQAQAWGNTLFNSLGAQTNFVAVAELGGVPEMFAPMVRMAIKSKRPRLLDWGNKYGRRWGFVDGKPLVMLIGPDGSVLAKCVGEIAESKLILFGVTRNLTTKVPSPNMAATANTLAPTSSSLPN